VTPPDAHPNGSNSRTPSHLICVSFLLSHEQRQALRLAAAYEAVSASSIVREAVSREAHAILERHGVEVPA
jgi:uncharacterized protein (DUF1778 family)